MDKSLPNHHWHYLYRRRRHKKESTSREILIGQLISLTGSIAAGYFLEVGKIHLALVAGAFLILPGIFDLGGSIGGALAAKIAHRLEEGKQSTHKIFLHSLFFAFAIAVVAAIFLSLFGAGLAAWLFDASFRDIFFSSILATTIVGLIGFPLVGLATILIYRLGLNPDNVIGPIETSIFDSLTIISLLIALSVVT